MVLPTKGNLPLQNRAGYNQGPQALTLLQAKFLGQPAVKCQAGDTVIFRNSPVVPGESNPRAVGPWPEVCGTIFNGTGTAISYSLVLIDDQGNEFTVVADHPMAPNPYENLAIDNIAGEFGLFCLPVNWSLVVRVSAGNPSAGQGLVVWPWAQDMSRNLVSIVQPLTTSGLVLGPPKGRAWQLCGSLFGAIVPFEVTSYLNFDSVERHVTEENVILAGEEFTTNTGGIVTVGSGDTEEAFADMLLIKTKGMILAYPDKIKVVAQENQTSAPLYLSINFAEFDLPRDMG